MLPRQPAFSVTFMADAFLDGRKSLQAKVTKQAVRPFLHNWGKLFGNWRVKTGILLQEGAVSLALFLDPSCDSRTLPDDALKFEIMIS